MKRYILPVLGIIALPLSAQNIVDATRFGSSTVTGTARYRSMGGAFGALGGDPSAMTDNPAGMGIYRGNSEISFTPNFSIARTKTDATIESKQKKADFSVSNLAYIISFKTDAEHLVNFNIGLGFNHREGLSRKYKTTVHYPTSSFGSYLANRLNNTLLNIGHYGDPDYLNSNAAWNKNSGIAPIELYGWDCYAVDQVYTEDAQGNKTLYDGVESYDQHCNLYSYQRLRVVESNRNDEYNLNFSGNWDDFIYGGLTMTVNDMNSTIETEFNEDYDISYNGDYTQYFNNLETKGTGFGIKAGILLKPTDTWRLGFAAHTPTWYRMEDLYNGEMTTNDVRLDQDENGHQVAHKYSGGTTYSYKYRYQSPWQAQISSAWVLGGRALVSLEADMKDFSTQKYKASNDYGDDDDYININDAIKDYNQVQMSYKAGAEYRVTDVFSVRAGYIYQTSPYKKDLYDNPANTRGWKNGYYGDDNGLLFESSTKPNHSLLGTQQYYTCGLGWGGDWWHLDLSVMNHIIHEKVASFATTDAIYKIENGVYTMTDDPVYGAVKGSYSDMRTNVLTWDLTIGIRF